jgi:thymidylate kinase
MREVGLQVQLLRFWDDIARLTRLRESAGHNIFKGDKGVGTPLRPILRRDKNVRSWPMTWVRLFLYFMDAISMRCAVNKALHSDADIVIFDRYIYDELANLELSSHAIRSYVKLIMKIVPRPHISYLLDADIVKAYARKPEYPLEFLYTNRQSYMALNNLVGGMTVIDPMAIHEVESAILGPVLKEMSCMATRMENCNSIRKQVSDDECIR